MQHKIGNNYTEYLKTVKGRKDVPPVLVLPFKVDVDKLWKEIQKIDIEEDTNTSETQYRLNRMNGEKFVEGYEDFIVNYSKITFQKMTEEAEEAIKTAKDIETIGPRERIKAMVDTSSEWYHPSYDERNYTVYTEHATGYIKEVIEMFKGQACRSAIVKLDPTQFLSRHVDVGPEFVLRCHIPLTTNEKSRMGFKVNGKWEEYHLPADGSIYAVNSGLEHYAYNFGDSVRVQMRVCVMGQEDLVEAEALQPVEFVDTPLYELFQKD